MLNLLDQTIRTVLDTGWTAAPPPAKPGFYFTIPDADWQTRVKAGVGNRLNIYLYEVRENRDFRRAEWDVILLPGNTAVQSRPPAYFDCHYLISAWSPVEDSEATTPILDEHQVLAEALRVLMRNPEVRPVDLGIVGGGPVFQQARVCLTVAPPETPRVLNDFWSTMKLPWRPGIQLVATAPLDLLQDTPPAPLMTTFIQRYLSIGGTGNAEVWIEIGGWVLRNADSSPIQGATVQRISTAGDLLEEVQTDDQGRYILTDLRTGINRVRVSAPGFATIVRDLDVPAGPPEDHIFKLS